MLEHLGIMPPSTITPRGDVVRVIELTPDPSVLSAIGRGHSIETALADTIDNSIDFHAHRIVVRFITSDSLVTAIEIHDDGDGMTPQKLEDAMTLGKRRDYEAGALGHFGIGLKASAMSQGRTLTVHTNSTDEAPSAMRLRRESGQNSFEAEVLLTQSVRHSAVASKSGTLVIWSDLDTVSRATDARERREWLETTVDRVQKHLGLIMHRLLQKGGLTIDVEVWDNQYEESGPPRRVEPVDPFNFSQWGKAGYPHRLRAVTEAGAPLEAMCYILPPNSKSPSARVFGRERKEWQGIYVYRNDRLLQPGGWLTLRTDGKSESQLARVAIDLTPALEDAITINPEKHDVRLQHDFIAALERASNDDGVTWNTFLVDAANVLIESNRRDTGAKPVKPVAEGLPPSLREVFDNALRVDDGALAATFGWKLLGEGRLFMVDPASGRIWLNAGYRRAFSTDPTNPEDAAFLKLSVFFAVQSWLGRNLRLVNMDQVKGIDRVMAEALFDGDTGIDYDPFGQEWDPFPDRESMSALIEPPEPAHNDRSIAPSVERARPDVDEVDYKSDRLGMRPSQLSDPELELVKSSRRRREVLEEAQLAYEVCALGRPSVSDLDYVVRMLAGHGVWSMSQVGALTEAPASFIRARMTKTDKTGGAFDPRTIRDLLALIDLMERDEADAYLTERIVEGGTRVRMISRLTGRSEASLHRELSLLNRHRS